MDTPPTVFKFSLPKRSQTFTPLSLSSPTEERSIFDNTLGSLARQRKEQSEQSDRSNSRCIPIELEKALLRVLLSPTDQLLKFSDICNCNEEVFGQANSQLKNKYKTEGTTY